MIKQYLPKQFFQQSMQKTESQRNSERAPNIQLFQQKFQQCKVTHRQGDANKICINPHCNFKNPFVCQLCEQRHQHQEGQILTIRISKMNALKETIQTYVNYAKSICQSYSELLSIVKQANIIVSFCKKTESKWEKVIQSFQNLINFKLEKIQSSNFSKPQTSHIWESFKSFCVDQINKYCSQEHVKLANKRTQIVNSIFQVNKDLNNQIYNLDTSNVLTNVDQAQKKIAGKEQESFFDKFYNLFKWVPIIPLPSGQKYQNQQNFSHFSSEIQKLLSTSKTKTQKYSLAKLYQLFNQTEKASEIYKSLIAEEPENIQLLSKRAAILKNNQRNEQAIQLYSRIIKTMQKGSNQQNIQLYYYQRGLLYQKNQNYSQAQKDFKKCLVNDKLGAVLKVVSMLKFQQKYGQIQQYLLNGLNNKYLNYDHKGSIYANLGQIKTMLKKPQQAIGYYSQAIKIQPKNFSNFIARAALNHQLNRYQQSKKDYTQAIQIKPSNTNLFYNRGVACLLLKQYDEATEDFLRVIQLDKEFKLAYFTLANLYLEQKKFIEALKFFEKCLKFYEQNAAIWYNIGRLNLLKDPPNQQEALKHINKAINLDPHFVQAYVIRIQLFMTSQNRFRQAEEDLNKLMDLNIRNSSTLHNRGVMRQKQGNLQGALSDFNQILQKDPNNLISLQARARIYFKTEKEQLYKQDVQKIKLLNSQKQRQVSKK